MLNRKLPLRFVAVESTDTAPVAVICSSTTMHRSGPAMRPDTFALLLSQETASAAAAHTARAGTRRECFIRVGLGYKDNPIDRKTRKTARYYVPVSAAAALCVLFGIVVPLGALVVLAVLLVGVERFLAAYRRLLVFTLMR